MGLLFFRILSEFQLKGNSKFSILCWEHLEIRIHIFTLLYFRRSTPQMKELHQLLPFLLLISYAPAAVIKKNEQNFINLNSTEVIALSPAKPTFASTNWYYTEFVEHALQGIKLQCMRDAASKSLGAKVTWYKDELQVIPDERYPFWLKL